MVVPVDQAVPAIAPDPDPDLQFGDRYGHPAILTCGQNLLTFASPQPVLLAGLPHSAKIWQRSPSHP